MSVWDYELHELSEGVSAVVYDEHGQRIADHLSEDRARLIAAAPELLEAAREFQKITQERINHSFLEAAYDLADWRKAERNLVAVIAKAEGQS